MNIDIVFENEHFVVVDKEPLVLTTPSREGPADERPCLGTALQTQVGRQIFPVHRLDFEVSGLVLFAKTAEAHAVANGWFEHKQVTKIYRARTGPQSFEHIPPQIPNPRAPLAPQPQEKFLWTSRLLRGKKRAYEHATGKPCETEAIFLGAEGGELLWELHPLTGRPHQLRYELSHHGFPILGDVLYGSKKDFAPRGIALRAVKIDFRRAPQAGRFFLPDILEVPAREI
jgi:tRNA pseudouridine32 synthase/23S rRNA pseudouridine746 synthase